MRNVFFFAAIVLSATLLTVPACSSVKTDPTATCDNGGACSCAGTGNCDHYCDTKGCIYANSAAAA
jgi:hypothetical protein